MALDLACDLRDRYNLRQPNYSRYDPRDILDAAFRKENEMRIKGAASAKRITKKAQTKKAGTAE